MKFIKIFVDFAVKKISMGRYSNQVPGLVNLNRVGNQQQKLLIV